MNNTLLRNVTFLAMILALCVVMLGAYTRLTDAGLGCPDWPGCYGHLVVSPHASSEPMVPQKAWTEMIHRYAAGSLALLVLTITFLLFYHRRQKARLPWRLSLLLLFLVLFQAALGMWTVTLKLLPLVVMAHLLGGISIFACICLIYLHLKRTEQDNNRVLRATVKQPIAQHPSLWIASTIPIDGFVLIGACILFIQIALGGWVSANYAGIACTGFPQCSGMWVPPMQWSQGFHLLSPIGTNYQGGVLEIDARMTIQWIHRLGALITASYILLLGSIIVYKTGPDHRFGCSKINGGWQSWSIFRRAALRTPENTSPLALPREVDSDRNGAQDHKTTHQLIRIFSLMSIFLVLAQCGLGIANVVYFLPLKVAVAHNGIAALLFATLCGLWYLTRMERIHASFR